MKNTLLLILAFVTTSTIGIAKPLTSKTIEPKIREYAFHQKPSLKPETRFEIEEFEVPGLKSALPIQLFFAKYLTPDGQRFSEMIFAYHDGKLTPFGSAFGGFGLMSAVVEKEILYYTYSWGSGIHR